MKCDICNPGLSKATEPERKQAPDCLCHIKPKPQEGKGCHDFKECPDCGVMFAHLEKPKSERERLAEKLKEWGGLGHSDALEAADIALAFLKSGASDGR